MSERPYNVLFLCTGNSARSILSEVILNARGKGLFKAYSAGSHPAGRVNPVTLDLLERQGLPTDGLRSKSWDEFAQPDSPPTTAHWGVPDPATVEGTAIEKAEAFRQAFRVLDRRITLFSTLPVASLDRMVLTAKVREIGKS